MTSRSSTDNKKRSSRRTSPDKRRKPPKPVPKEEAPDFGAFGGDAFGGGADFGTSNNTHINAFDASLFSTDFDANNKVDFQSNTGSVDLEEFDETPAFRATEPQWDTVVHQNVPKASPQPYRLECSHMRSWEFLTDPVVSPSTGNLVFCVKPTSRASQATVSVYEATSTDHRDVLPLKLWDLPNPELVQRIRAKYHATVSGIQSVKKLYVTNTKQLCLVLDVTILESPKPLRLLIGYEYCSVSQTLLFVLTPPAGGDFEYNLSTFGMEHELLCLGGQSKKGACVFLCNYSLKPAWSANFLSHTTTIVSLSVQYPYLVVGTLDGMVTLWSVQNPSSSNKRWLFPVGRFDNGVLESLKPVDGSGRGKSDEIGYATHFSWLKGPLPLLAVSYQNGFAIYRVELPMEKGPGGKARPLPEPTATTVVANTPILKPIAAQRWNGATSSKSAVSSLLVSWSGLLDPCVVVLQHETSKLMFFSIQFPTHSPKELLPVHLLATTDLPKTINGLLPGTGTMPSIFCFSERQLYTVSLRGGNTRERMQQPVCSAPPGLDSYGDPRLVDCKSDKDGILHVFSTVCSVRQEDSSGLLVWSPPSRKYWLCRTVVGDTNETKLVDDEEAKDESFGEEVTGGSSSQAICEIVHELLVDLEPIRIVRSRNNACAIVYGPALGKDRLNGTTVALVDFAGPIPCIKVLPGRDVAFLPSKDGSDIHCGLLLSHDGAATTIFEWKTPLDPSFGDACRPIVGVNCDKDYLDCFRLFTFAEGSEKVSLAVIGRRVKDDRIAFLSGDPCDVAAIGKSSWSKLLPNSVSGRSRYLDANEFILTAYGLEGDGSGYRNFALATNCRVIILSSALTIAAESRSRPSSSSLVPLGSFSVGFVSGSKLRYICCLSGHLMDSCISSIVRRGGSASNYFPIALRPDRLLLYPFDTSLTNAMNESFALPAASITPVLLLEPMIANAICAGGKHDPNTVILRNVIEKFGRKVASITHGENEGIGSLGSGLTANCLEQLGKYDLKQAATWLLTGTVQFERSANTRILPPWLPIGSKAPGAIDSDVMLHVLTTGDSYLNNYMKSADPNDATTLPRPSDPVSYLAYDHATKHLREGKQNDSIKVLDLVGKEHAENAILQLSLLSEAVCSNGHSAGMLDRLSGVRRKGLGLSQAVRTPASIAALATALKTSPSTNQQATDFLDQWVKPLSLSSQKARRVTRFRHELLGKPDVEGSMDGKPSSNSNGDRLWMTPCGESKHIWNEGPLKQKENLLALDQIEDWLGRRRPLVLGKEGASAAKDRGEKTLADILTNDTDNSFGAEVDDLRSSKDSGWVDGVGEGRSDEANLSGYFRFSEGDQDAEDWKTSGFLDVSPYQNYAQLLGSGDNVTLKQSSSGVDEGEPGKVRSLFDVVFGRSGVEALSGLAIPATRGGSLDVGLLHTADKDSRMRCSIEFWYYLPEAHEQEMILARRTMGKFAGDLSQSGLASSKEFTMWELVLGTSGELSFRTCAGDTLKSTLEKNDDDDDDEIPRPDVASYGRWNHVCVVLSSKGLRLSQCNVSVYMKGVEIVSQDASVLPQGISESELEAGLGDLTADSHLLFALNHMEGFRLTELRIWACARSASDISSFLYEYLTAAEHKKKFKVKIANKNKRGTLLGKGLGLAPPKGSAPAKLSRLAPSGLSGQSDGTNPKRIGVSLVPPPKPTLDGIEEAGEASMPVDGSKRSPSKKPGAKAFENSFASFGQLETSTSNLNESKRLEQSLDIVDVMEQEKAAAAEQAEAEAMEEDVAATLWDTAIPLSQQIRPSAASALIRGPPATRHYGGNRGGLPDFSGTERFGVGGIALCGSEKTIVFRDNEDPPSLSYPIGASGAVVSDQMDDEGSEFLCCFLAKEGRMVVFELRSRTVVVELQMSTKLNFWRYLPPEASENTLCFMLVTPVGGFHWMPLEDNPRPKQVWKRGNDLHGKKIVSYEEGGSNGLDGPEIMSRVGLILASPASGGDAVEGWLIPIAGDSKAFLVSDDLLGACLSQPLRAEADAFLPNLVLVQDRNGQAWVTVVSVLESKRAGLTMGKVQASLFLDESDFDGKLLEPPSLAMGTFPESICVSLSNIVVVILRRKGLVAAFEIEEDELNLIAQETVDHYVIDAVMRYSPDVGGAEIVMLLSDDENPKDGRIVSFCFRSIA